AFRRLLAAGDSLVVIEHNLEVIRAADRLVDLGPEGGDAGGELVCEGTPAEVARHPTSHTGKALREYEAALHAPATLRVEDSRPARPEVLSRLNGHITVHNARE